MTISNKAIKIVSTVGTVMAGVAGAISLAVGSKAEEIAIEEAVERKLNERENKSEE